MAASGGERVLGVRELNRALLARQMLLGRERVPALAAVERLVALQAQVVSPPHVGLFSRVAGFRREDLVRSLAGREVVRATLLRSTLHLMTSEDYLAFRGPLQPALERALRAFFGSRAKEFEADGIMEAGRERLAGGPLSRGELGAALAEVYPGADPAALSYAAGTYLPLVQVPSESAIWGYPGKPPYALAEDWIGSPVPEERDARPLVLRYLAAFGPASVMDFQTWSGLTRMKPVFERLRPELRTARDRSGRELFDLPDAPLPDPETPAPPRFVPDYDNLVLSHADRSRIVREEDRKRVFLSAARVRATVLVDGFVAGTWAVEEKRGEATLTVEPFDALDAGTRDALAEEAERLVRFVREDARTHDVRFAPAS